MARPTQEIFLVTPFTDSSNKQRQRWIKIGVAFPHKDHSGVSLRFNITPSQDDLSKGNLVLRNIESSDHEKAHDDDEDHKCDDPDCIINRRNKVA